MNQNLCNNTQCNASISSARYPAPAVIHAGQQGCCQSRRERPRTGVVRRGSRPDEGPGLRFSTMPEGVKGKLLMCKGRESLKAVEIPFWGKEVLPRVKVAGAIIGRTHSCDPSAGRPARRATTGQA